MKKNYANMTKAFPVPRLPPSPPDTASRPFSCAVPSDPLRPLTLLSPSATPACPRLCSVPRSRTPRPARVSIPLPQRRALPSASSPPSAPSLRDTAVPAFRRRLSPAFSRASRNTVPPLLPACGLRHAPACAPSRGPGPRGLPAFRSPSRNAAPRPCIFPALRMPPRQKQAKFRQ